MVRLWKGASTSVIPILCLALGLGASSAALSLADATALRPFGLPSAADLVVLWVSDPARPADLSEISLPGFQDWERRSTSFVSLAAFGSSHWPGIGRASGESFPIAPRAVSRRFFVTLGRSPVLGRDFNDDDLALANPPPVMLSHAFWVSRFRSSPTAVGQTLFIDNEVHRIVGVMPQGYAFPDAPDVWISVERALQQAFQQGGVSPVQQRALGVLMAVGRLRPGVSHERARVDLNRIEVEIQQEFMPKQKPLVAVVTPFTDAVLGKLGARVWIALAMTIAVLLFACTNVSALRAAQLRNRVGELSARLCLGASRARLTGDLLRETVPLVVVSAVTATVVAVAIETWLRLVPVVAASGIDLAQSRGLTFGAIAVFAILAWLLVSVVPAVGVARRVTPADVTLGSRSIVRGSRGVSLMLTVQAALALCLVAMAGGAFRAFANLAATDVGFATSDVTLVDVSVPGWKYATPAQRTRLDRAIADALGTVPGATAAAGVSVRPFRFGEIADGMRVRRPEDVVVESSNAVAASRVIVTPQYFTALGIDLVEGRALTDVDAQGKQVRVVVSRSLASALWGEARAVGNELEFYTLSRGWQRVAVVGVASDVRSRVMERPTLEVYVPHGTGGIPLGSFVIRHERGREIGTAALRAALERVDPDVVIESLQTTRGVVDRVIAPSRLLSTAMTLLGGTGLVLLTLGIFGAAATSLRVARREVAVRQAFGATPFGAARAPLRSLFAAIGLGTLAGSVLAPGAVGLLATMGVAEHGGLLMAMGVAALAVLAAAGLAIAINIRRAVSVSPADLLRTD